MVHRNALRILGSRVGGRPRTPLGYRTNLVNNKNVHYRPGSGKSSVERYYYDEDGNIPYQMYYPGVDGVWPLHRWRLLWTWYFDWKAKRKGQDPNYRRASGADTPDVNEWNGTRLPGDVPAPAATIATSAAPVGPCQWKKISPAWCTSTWNATKSAPDSSGDW